MSVVSTAIARPVTVVMATIAVLLFGFLSVDRLGLNLLPELSYPTLTIRTDFEGAAPAEVEEQITRRIEERAGVINGLRRMHSVSAAERSDVILEFAWGTDMDLAAVEVREKLDLVRLPLNIERPSLLRLNPNLDPIIRLGVLLKKRTSDEISDLQNLLRFAEEFLKKRLDPVSGVAAVLVSGGYEDEIAVHVDQHQLARLNLTVQQLGQRLQAANVNLSGGRLTDRGQEFLVRTLNEFETMRDIRDTIIFQREGSILRLKDVADVYQGHKERDSVMRVDGFEAIEIALYKEGDANTVAVAEEVRSRIEDIRKLMPPSYELVVIYDQALFISAAIDEVRSAALTGAALAIFVLLLFLKDLRSTLIVAATIPVSVMVTFSMMDYFGISLNIMSLGGIALAVGMLMDNAIVVLENIARHREAGLSVAEAANTGASEVGGAVTASTLTTIAVFLPLAFVEGIAGQLFRDQALTVTFALVASLVLAFTFIPMLSSLQGRTSVAPTQPLAALPRWRRWLSAPFRWVARALVAAAQGVRWIVVALFGPVLWLFDRGYRALFYAYGLLLRAALRFRILTLFLAASAFGLTALLIPYLPVELIPPLSQNEFRIDLELAPGTRLEKTDHVLESLQRDLMSIPVVERTYASAGTGGKLDASSTQGGEQVGEINVVLMPGLSSSDEEAVMEAARGLLADISGAQYTVDRPQLFTFATPLEIEVSGTDLGDIEAAAAEIVAAMSRSESFSDVESSIRPGYPELQIEFDPERTAALGMFVPDVANRVVRKVRGDVPTRFTWRDKRVDIRIRLDETERDSQRDIEELLVSDGGQGEIPLSSVAKISVATGPADIQRIGQQRVAVVSAHVTHGDLSAAAEEVGRILVEVPIPPNVSSRIGGQNEEMEASFQSLMVALILALVMVYLVMASLFESFLHPFVIMFTVPLAAIGAILGIYLSGVGVSVVVFIGLILLVGIVVNNAIVLIDRVNQLRIGGSERRAALVLGAEQRFRPILMTTMTTVFGLLPMAIGLGEASELRTPMAITVIGGLSVSMLLTLVVIPVVYDLVDRRRIEGDVFEESSSSVA